MDYREYYFTKLQILKQICITVCIALGISYLFYRSLWGMVFTPVLLFFSVKRERRNCREKRQRMLHGQFMDSLKVVSTSLMSGMSMENAWKEAAEEIHVMHGEKSIMYTELEEMNCLVASNVPMEKVLIHFAYRSGVEDIISFAEAFEYGKRSGANWKKLISDTTLRMEEKYETEKQIEVMLAEKRMEQKVMSVIPLGMIAFLQVSSGDYMDILYGNPVGCVCMTICLMGYAAALVIAEKIMKIQV